MKFSTLDALLVLAAGTLSARASPMLARQSDSNITDADVLNYALTLEHLENTFYSQSLANFSEDAFTQAGFPSWVRARLTMVASHEQTHVSTLSGALQQAGAPVAQPCEYNFGVTDVASFVATSATVEAIGSSAYTGAAQFISTKGYLTVAASILATEARHSSWLFGAVQKQNPWGTAFETPLSLSQVYTMASAFITSCPSDNPTLPVQAFPALTVTPSGTTSTLSFEGSESQNGDFFAAVLIGLEPTFVPITKGDDGSLTVEISQDITCGPAYLLITNQNGTMDDASTVAGPAPVRLPCNSAGNPI